MARITEERVKGVDAVVDLNSDEFEGMVLRLGSNGSKYNTLDPYHEVLPVEDPEASNDPRFKFTITNAGVFRIADVIQSIEMTLGLSPGEGESHVQLRIDEGLRELEGKLEEGDHPILIPSLSMCSGRKPGYLDIREWPAVISWLMKTR